MAKTHGYRRRFRYTVAVEGDRHQTGSVKKARGDAIDLVPRTKSRKRDQRGELPCVCTRNRATATKIARRMGW